MPGVTTQSPPDSACASNVDPGVLSGAPVTPGTARVEGRGIVRLALADLAWAKLGNFITVAIDAHTHRLGLRPCSDTVSMGNPMLRYRNRFHGWACLRKYLRDIGVDPAKAARCEVVVTRDRRGEHGTRQLLLTFPADLRMDRARKNKHVTTQPHGDTR